jgi:hypothetical protein
MIGQEQLMTTYTAFISFIQNDLKQGRNFHSEHGALFFQLPSGKMIKYELKRRQVIRSVKKPGEKKFKGHMVLLQEVYMVLFIPDAAGVRVEVGMQNWHADLYMKTYIHGRVVKSD